MCAETTGTAVGPVLAVKNEKVLNLQDEVEENDVIDVYPALSGG
jgi:sulfur carrier protein ThiS